MESSPISNFLYSLIHTLPFLFIYFIGLVLSFVFRRRLGRIWLVAGFAFLIHMLAMLVSIGSQFFFYFYIIPSRNYELSLSISRVITVLVIGLQIAGYALMLVALFARRDSKSLVTDESQRI